MDKVIVLKAGEGCWQLASPVGACVTCGWGRGIGETSALESFLTAMALATPKIDYMFAPPPLFWLCISESLNSFLLPYLYTAYWYITNIMHTPTYICGQTITSDDARKKEILILQIKEFQTTNLRRRHISTQVLRLVEREYSKVIFQHIKQHTMA